MLSFLLLLMLLILILILILVPLIFLTKGMDYIKLGDSDLIVSKVCMGTMTYGIQNTLDEGIQLLNRSFDEYGINFLDTAEIYPVPPNGETQGETDRIVCEFLKGRNRKDVILATKVAGRQPMLGYLPRANGKSSGDYGGMFEISNEERTLFICARTAIIYLLNSQ